MFEEYIEFLDDLQTNIEDYLKINYSAETRKSIAKTLEVKLREALVKAGTLAVDKVEEFGGYKLLRDRFITNLKIEDHVKVDKNTGEIITLFSEEVGGTYQDLIDGWEEASGHTGTKSAPNIWKYGIYIPAREGGIYNKEKGFPTYDSVIRSRLSFWGEKTPYWYFIEHGNVGNGREYPSFSGTDFIADLRQRANQAVRFLSEEYFNYVLDALGDDVIKTLRVPSKSTRVTIAYVNIPGGKLSIQQTSTGKILGRIGNTQINTVDLIQRLESMLK